MAAGLGFKDFQTGEVLTAADVDGYLMQNIWVFASAAARDAAVTSPQEGNFAYLKDTNVTTYYTGSAWANLDTTGMTNPMTTTGDTIYSSSGSTPARLGIGSTGQVLTVAGGIPSWATASGGSLTLSTIASGSLPASSTLSLTGLTGDYYMLQIDQMTYATADSNMIMQFNTNTGANYASISVSTTNADQAIYTAGSSFVIGTTTTISRTGTENGWIVEIKNSKNNGFHTATWMGRSQSSGGNRAIMGQGYFMDATTITSIQVKISDGYSWTGGTYKLIGG